MKIKSMLFLNRHLAEFKAWLTGKSMKIKHNHFKERSLHPAPNYQLMMSDRKKLFNGLTSYKHLRSLPEVPC